MPTKKPDQHQAFGSRLLLFSPDSAGLDFCALQFVLIALSIALKFVRSEDDTIPTAVRFLTDMAADALESDIQLTRFGLFCGFIRTTLHHVRDIRHFLLFGHDFNFAIGQGVYVVPLFRWRGGSVSVGLGLLLDVDDDVDT